MRTKFYILLIPVVYLISSPASADELDLLLSNLTTLVGEMSDLVEEYRTVQDSTLYPYEVAFNKLVPVMLDSLYAGVDALSSAQRDTANDVINLCGYLDMCDAYFAVQGPLPLASKINLLAGIITKVKNLLQDLLKAFEIIRDCGWFDTIVDTIDDVLDNFLKKRKK